MGTGAGETGGGGGVGGADNRRTVRDLAGIYRLAKEANPGIVPVFQVASVGSDRSLKFVGSVEIEGVTYVPAGDTGKVKSFADVDAFVAYMSKCCEASDGVYQVSVNTASILASKVPNDMKAWAASQIVSLSQKRTGQVAVVNTIDQQLSLMIGWEAGNQAQRAKKAEVEAQRACVQADIAAIDAEVTRLTAIANA